MTAFPRLSILLALWLPLSLNAQQEGEEEKPFSALASIHLYADRASSRDQKLGDVFFISQQGHFLTLRKNLIPWLKAPHLYNLKLKNPDDDSIEPLQLGACQKFPQGVPSLCYLKARYGPYHWFKPAEGNKVPESLQMYASDKKLTPMKLKDETLYRGHRLLILESSREPKATSLPITGREKREDPLFAINVTNKSREVLAIPHTSIKKLIEQTRSFTTINSSHYKSVRQRLMWPDAPHLSRKEQKQTVEKFHQKAKEQGRKSMEKLKEFFKKHQKSMSPKLKAKITNFATRSQKEGGQKKSELKKMLKKHGLSGKKGKKATEKVWEVTSQLQQTQLPANNVNGRKNTTKRLMKNAEKKEKFIKGLINEEKKQKAQGSKKDIHQNTIQHFKENLQKVRGGVSNYLRDAI